MVRDARSIGERAGAVGERVGAAGWVGGGATGCWEAVEAVRKNGGRLTAGVAMNAPGVGRRGVCGIWNDMLSPQDHRRGLGG